MIKGFGSNIGTVMDTRGMEGFLSNKGTVVR